MWAAALAGVALLATWACFDFDWPATPRWTFYAPYSLYTVEAWTLAVEIFAVLVVVRVLVVLRRRRTARLHRRGAT